MAWRGIEAVKTASKWLDVRTRLTSARRETSSPHDPEAAESFAPDRERGGRRDLCFFIGVDPGRARQSAAVQPLQLQPELSAGGSMPDAGDLLRGGLRASGRKTGRRPGRPESGKHPSFPKSVCGVVFDGSTRSTGCQFTFTCDGSLSREPAARKWAEAESVAADALTGRSDDQVGKSTHYHAAWMVPYWRSSMVETVRIGGHVFYQRRGCGAQGPR